MRFVHQVVHVYRALADVGCCQLAPDIGKGAHRYLGIADAVCPGAVGCTGIPGNVEGRVVDGALREVILQFYPAAGYGRIGGKLGDLRTINRYRHITGTRLVDVKDNLVQGI